MGLEVGQALFIPSRCEGLPVQRNLATADVDTQECLSYEIQPSPKHALDKSTRNVTFI